MQFDSLSSTINPALLEEAFNRFNEASLRLQSKYEALLHETEILRNQLYQKDLEIKRAERLSVLGEMAAALAHEVRNPLGAIKLFASMLRKDVADRPEALSLVQQMERSLQSLDHTVSNVLHFSKGKPPAFSPLNLNSLIHEQVSHFEASRGGSTTSSFTFKTKLEANPFMTASEQDLRQVLYNLVLNALQATKWQGEVVISTEDIDSNQLKLSIRDNGPGIPAEILPTIFDPFVTSKKEGTGLGLAIVRQIIVLHRGQIEVKNEAGAEFTIYLPRTQAA